MMYQSITVPVGDSLASVYKGGTGPVTVLLIPGGPGFSALTMLPEAEMLEGYASWLAIDPPGSGLSTSPTEPAGYGIEEHARWYRDVCEQLGITSVHLLGASFGGMVAITLADIAPNLVASLVCISTSIKGADVDVTGAESDAIEAALARHSNSDWYEHSRYVFDNWTDLVFEAKSDEEVSALNKAITPLYLADPDNEVVKGRLQRLDQFQLSLEAMIAWESGVYQSMDIRSHLVKIKQPILFISGEFDWMAGPVFAQSALSLNGNAELKVITESGHMPSIENPDDLGACLRAWFSRFRAVELVGI